VASAKNSNVAWRQASTTLGEWELVIKVKLVLSATSDAATFITLVDSLLNPGWDCSSELIHFAPLHNVIWRIREPHMKLEHPTSARVLVLVASQFEEAFV
jgi:hypothetical protein